MYPRSARAQMMLLQKSCDCPILETSAYASDSARAPGRNALSYRRLSKKSFVGFYMARDDLSRLRRSQTAASRPKKARSAHQEVDL